MVAAGVTTDAIDALVTEETIKRGAYPSPLKYKGFPKSCCTSVNEVICHGIPDKRELVEGDIVNIDVTTCGPRARARPYDGARLFHKRVSLSLSPYCRWQTRAATCATRMASGITAI